MPPPLTIQQWLTEVRNRVRLATPGEWEFWTGNSWRRFGVKGTCDTVLEPSQYSRSDHTPTLNVSDADTDVIAHATTDLRRLLALVELLEYEIHRLSGAVEESNFNYGEPVTVLDPPRSPTDE
jgi:hypothetical protein